MREKIEIPSYEDIERKALENAHLWNAMHVARHAQMTTDEANRFIIMEMTEALESCQDMFREAMERAPIPAVIAAPRDG